MRKIIWMFSLLLLPMHAHGQWHKIADFEGMNEGLTFGETIECVYFLDLPGPPRIGYVGTESELWKTTDGGTSWKRSWGNGGTYSGYCVDGITFKDSLTGWFALFNSSGLEDTTGYSTTDGGNTWIPMKIPGSLYGSFCIFYDSLSDLLFLSMPDTGMEVSSDLGKTWKIASPYRTYGFSFSSPAVGIVSELGPLDTSGGYLRTTDGGISWSWNSTTNYGYQPLAIPDTAICFEVDEGGVIVRRSDDYGRTWSVVCNFGPLLNSNYVEISPASEGMICGDLNHLFIETDSGIFESTDQGISWQNTGGPPFVGAEGNPDFYATKGVTFAGATTLHSPSSNGIVNGGGLWEYDWAQSGVVGSSTGAPEPSSGSIAVSPNPTLGTFTLSSSEPVVSLQVRNVLGTEVLSLPHVEGRTIPLDLTAEPSGTYFIEIGTATGTVLRKIVRE